MNSFYANLAEGDVVLVFATTKITGKGNFGRVMYVFVVEERWPVKWYLTQKQFQNRYDNMYDTSKTPWARNTNGGPWHRGDEADTRQDGGLNDFERDQTRTVVLMSRRYKDVSDRPQALPPQLKHLVHSSQGCCKTTLPHDAANVIAHFGL